MSNTFEYYLNNCRHQDVSSFFLCALASGSSSRVALIFYFSFLECWTNEDQQRRKLWKLVDCDDFSLLLTRKFRSSSFKLQKSTHRLFNILVWSMNISSLFFGRVGMVSNYKLYFSFFQHPIRVSGFSSLSPRVQIQGLVEVFLSIAVVSLIPPLRLKKI